MFWKRKQKRNLEKKKREKRPQPSPPRPAPFPPRTAQFFSPAHFLLGPGVCTPSPPWLLGADTLGPRISLLSPTDSRVPAFYQWHVGPARPVPSPSSAQLNRTLPPVDSIPRTTDFLALFASLGPIKTSPPKPQLPFASKPRKQALVSFIRDAVDLAEPSVFFRRKPSVSPSRGPSQGPR